MMKLCNKFIYLPNVAGATAFFVLTYSKQHILHYYSVITVVQISPIWLLCNN